MFLISDYLLSKNIYLTFVMRLKVSIFVIIWILFRLERGIEQQKNINIHNKDIYILTGGDGPTIDILYCILVDLADTSHSHTQHTSIMLVL